jgi:hypothetical protein
LVLSLVVLSSKGAVPQTALSFGPAELQPLLQRFVDAEYGKAFRHLGDERDFDHGHVLMAQGNARPVAILYHTQELAHREAPGSDFGFLPSKERNWLQWTDTGQVENASAYERRSYPSSASWDWFKARELPALSARGTITDVMLDPARLGFEPASTRQWTFTAVSCSEPAENSRPRISVRLPNGQPVCLSLEVL